MIEFSSPSSEFKRLNPHIFAEHSRIDPTPQTTGSAHNDLSLERKLQAQIYADLSRRELYFHYQRSDKATRGTVGSPDFILPYRGQFLAIECKTETGQLNETQKQVSEKIKAQGGVYHIVRGFDEYLEIIARVRALQLRSKR